MPGTPRMMLTISSAFCFQQLQVVAVDLHREFALDAADRFLHVVGDGLGEVPDHAGNLVQLRFIAAISSLFVLVEDGSPLVLGLQIDEVLGVEESGRVGAVVGAADLAGTTCVTSGNRANMTRA